MPTRDENLKVPTTLYRRAIFLIQEDPVLGSFVK